MTPEQPRLFDDTPSDDEPTPEEVEQIRQTVLRMKAPRDEYGEEAFLLMCSIWAGPKEGEWQ